LACRVTLDAFPDNGQQFACDAGRCHYQYDLSNLSSEDQGDLLNDLTSSGLLQPGLVFNIEG
jgi:hypothetical protein